MELAVNLAYFSRNLGLEQSAKMVKNSGFRYLDFSLRGDGWEQKLEEAQKIFAQNGLTVYQSHAPFNRYGEHGSRENHMKLVQDTLDAASRMQAKYLVIHGDEFPFDEMEYSKEKVLLYNYELFAPVVERAEKLGVSVAFENLFEDWDRPRFCSEAEDLNALIDRFGGSVCCCWDFGHGAVSYGEEAPGAIERMDGKIQCTHVHDNYFYSDAHLIPFLGKIDWSKTMKALHKGGVPEVLSFEMVYGYPPEKPATAMTEMLKQVGDELIGLV